MVAEGCSDAAEILDPTDEASWRWAWILGGCATALAFVLVLSQDVVFFITQQLGARAVQFGLRVRSSALFNWLLLVLDFSIGFFFVLLLLVAGGLLFDGFHEAWGAPDFLARLGQAHVVGSFSWTALCVTFVWVAMAVRVVCLMRLFSKANQHPAQEQQQQQQQQHKATNNKGVKYLFCSRNLGVNESYKSIHYYQDAFSEDETRVNRLFDSHKSEIPLCSTQPSHSTLTLKKAIDVISHHEHEVIAIMLVDNRVLCCCDYHDDFVNDNNNNSNDNNNNERIQTSEKSKMYAGHYVILVGVSVNPEHVLMARTQDACHHCHPTHHPHHHHDETMQEEQQPQEEEEEEGEEDEYCLILKNPGKSNPNHYVTHHRLQRAWNANGTDEDIIFVARHF